MTGTIQKLSCLACGQPLCELLLDPAKPEPPYGVVCPCPACGDAGLPEWVACRAVVSPAVAPVTVDVAAERPVETDDGVFVSVVCPDDWAAVTRLVTTPRKAGDRMTVEVELVG